MAIQLSVGARNARLDAIETAIGTSAVLKIRSQAQPASCATGDAGSALAVLNLQSDWMGAASSGSKQMSGTWQTTASMAGIAEHFRLYASDGTTCHLQGSVTMSGSGGDLTLDNTNIAASQVVTITSFTLTDGNA